MDTRRPLRVLVVDDELLIRWSIAETLRGEGHTAIEASDAASVRRALAEIDEPVDVVLLDLRLPDSRDLALLEDIRRLTPQSAVVMMTAYGVPEIEARALALGAHRFIDKPFDMHDLQPILQEAHAARPAAPR